MYFENNILCILKIKLYDILIKQFDIKMIF